MKRWIEMLSLAAISLGLFTATPSDVSAQYGNGYNYCDPCQPCDPCADTGCGFGDFKVAVDFIYWKTCVDNLDYAADFNYGSNEGKDFLKYNYKRICPTWTPGFRVAVAKPGCWGQWALSASYARISDTECSTARREVECENGRGGFVTTPLLHAYLIEEGTGAFTEVKGKYHVEFNTYDVLASYPCNFCGCHQFIPFFGIGGMQVSQELETALFNPCEVNGGFIGGTKWNSSFHAIGLKAGSDYEYRFSECFKVFSKASGTIAAGEPTSKTRQFLEANEFDETVRVKDKYDCYIIPGYHLQLGVAYESSMCNMDWNIRLGYEFVKWHNVPNPRRFANADPEAGSIATSADNSTIGFHGLLVGVDAKF